MNDEHTRSRTSQLVFLAAALTAVLMIGVSTAGLLVQVYPTEVLRQAFVPNDVVNLMIGVPVLLWTALLARRGQLIGVLFLPGALFFVFYTYVAYVVALPLGSLYAAYLLLAVLSVCAAAALIVTLDAKAIQRQLQGAVPERFGAGVLIVLGALFLMRAIGVLINGATALPAEYAVSIADVAITPVWIIGGVLLWRRQALGYALGAGLLFQASLLFIALIGVLILQPILMGSPFPVADIVVIAVTGVVCFVPFGLFLRGMLSKSSPARVG